MAADEVARAERLERIRRQLVIEGGRGRQVPVGWNEADPWSTVFVELTKDTSFWDERVHHPANAWVAAGGRGVPTVASEADVLAHVPGAAELGVPEITSTGDKSRRQQANRDKRAAQKKRKIAEREELQRFRAQPKQSTSSSSGKGKGGGKSKDQTGAALCFAWAAGTGACGKLGPGSECVAAVKRVHKCRKCLSPSHRDADCPA